MLVEQYPLTAVNKTTCFNGIMSLMLLEVSSDLCLEVSPDLVWWSILLWPLLVRQICDDDTVFPNLGWWYNIPCPFSLAHANGTISPDLCYWNNVY